MAESMTTPTVSTIIEGAGESMVVIPTAPSGDVEKAKKQVNSTGHKVHRMTKVKEPKDAFERSVYAKGFLENKDMTLQQCLEVFFNMYGAISSFRMLRDKNKKFKASVFAEFVDFEMVEKFLKAEPKPTFEGKELLIMSKGDYCNMKIKEKGLTGKAAVHRSETIAKG